MYADVSMHIYLYMHTQIFHIHIHKVCFLATVNCLFLAFHGRHGALPGLPQWLQESFPKSRVLVIRALLFGIYIWGPDFLETSPRTVLMNVVLVTFPTQGTLTYLRCCYSNYCCHY